MRQRTLQEMLVAGEVTKIHDSHFHNDVIKANKRITSSYAFMAYLLSFQKYFEKIAGPQGLNIMPDKYVNQWYLKRHMGSYECAAQEVIAQEVFRLFIPGQPKTRIIHPGDTSDDYHVISKEVPGYITLLGYDQKQLGNRIRAGEFHGFGEVMVIALLANEMDLSLFNLGHDANNQIIKIDGELCLQELAARRQLAGSRVSEKDIRALPKLANYKACNWFDYRVNLVKFVTKINDDGLVVEERKEYISEDHSGIIISALMDCSGLRDEINKALLKVLMFPESKFQDFVKCYVSQECLAESIATLLCKRRSMMQEAMLKNTDFCRYMMTDAAASDYDAYANYLNTFVMLGKEGLNLMHDDNYMLPSLQVLRNSIVTSTNKSALSPGLFASPATLRSTADNTRAQPRLLRSQVRQQNNLNC